MLNLFTHIGGKVKAANPWLDAFAVNCIQLPNGKIVNIIGIEKDDFSFDDSKGKFFYIRVNPRFEYTVLRQLSSATTEYRVTVKFNFVFFSAGTEENLDPVKLENNFVNNFRLMNFGDYFGPERQPQIIIGSSNIDASAIFKTETKKDLKSGTDLTAVSIDGQLRFLSTNNCLPDCGQATSENILQSFNFCDPSVLAQLCYDQKECLEKEFGKGIDCDKLNECPIIQEMQQDIENLSGSNTFIAGETLGGQRVLQLSGGKAFYFDPTDENNVGRQLGMSDGAAVLNAAVPVKEHGIVNNPGWGLIPDSIYYADANGLISIVPPVSGIAIRVGVAVDADNLKLEFSEPIILI